MYSRPHCAVRPVAAGAAGPQGQLNHRYEGEPVTGGSTRVAVATSLVEMKREVAELQVSDDDTAIQTRIDGS